MRPARTAMALALGLAVTALALPAGAQQAKKKDKAAAADARETVTLVCEAVYLPARTTWTRTVRIAYDKQRVQAVHIDGVPAYTFSVQKNTIATALDNERIQIDVAAQTWSSDFRGQATAQGRCERE
ncbi:hypothetical protein [Hydrogenophaga palleronii]|uniref:hypothetical protein n=1 Tax=Hydrogenophaga palleronii TaxID=65655 RepID=UPI0012EDF863|nr:hypothetical protein [Hydrogenophaga palleronii]